ncbi:hypothetical protein CEXT_219721 [Caerostris extrusa]|uniref:Uncharacterized protein n=1 Tax=Caerostris extrusa TaxID=172846 RepID=A0AAV4QS80_CAEEX|nr:hypothetical protein CEXT_219721 [Caerostris extrusa]
MVLYRLGKQPGKDRTISLADLQLQLEHAACSIFCKGLPSAAEFSTGSKHADVDPHLQGQNHQSSPLILGNVNETATEFESPN